MATKKMEVTGITKLEIEALIEHWEKFARCYFWLPPGGASERRREEKRQYRNVDFAVDGKPVNCKIEITCSCKNYYAAKDLTVDGSRVAQGLRYLKKVLNNGVFA